MNTGLVTLRAERATSSDIGGCHALLHAFDEEQGIPLGTVGWSHPRVRAAVQADAEAGRLFAVRDGAALVATFALCDVADPYFVAGSWAQPDAPVRILHRLAVAKDRRATGVGAWCLRVAEAATAESGSTYLRLDALVAHPRVVAWYQRQGYSACGTARLASGEPRNPMVELVLFEKRVRPAGP